MANIITFIPTTVGQGDETSIYTKQSETAFDLAVTVAGTNDARPSHGSTVSPDMLLGDEITVTFNAVINGGIPKIRSYNTGAGTQTLNYECVSGLNTIVLNMEGTRDNLTFYWDGRLTWDVSITNYNAELPVTTTTVEVEWIDSISAAATGNKIYRDDVEIADIANGVQIYQDTTAETGTEYKYEVQAYSATDETTQEVTGVNTQTITTA